MSHVCGDCKYFVFPEKDVTPGTCHLNPPSVLVVPPGGGIINGERDTVPIESLRPKVRSGDMACYRWQPYRG